MDRWLASMYGPTARMAMAPADGENGASGDNGNSGGDGSGSDGDGNAGTGSGSDGDGDGEGEGDGDSSSQQRLTDLGGEGDDDSASKDLAGDRQGDRSGDGDTPKFTVEQRPDWLPEKFFDKETGEVRVEDIVKAEATLRQRIGDQGNVPETPDGYEFETPDDLKEVADLVLKPGDDGKDGREERFKKIAHEVGLRSDQAAKLRNWFIGDMADDLKLQEIDAKAEFKKLGPEQQARNIIRVQNDFGENLLRLGVFDKSMHNEYWATLQTADGIRMINAIREFYGEQAVPLELGNQAANTSSADELRGKQAAIMQDLADQKISEAEANRRYENLMAEYEGQYGTDPAGSSAAPS